MATELLMDAAAAWFDGDFAQAGEHVTAARTAVATALVRLAELESSAGLLPSSGGTHPRAIAYEQWLQMAAPLVAKILDDPHRYEIHGGGDLVYDRLTNQYYNGRTGRYAAVNVGRIVLDDGLCGDCLSGRCHGGSPCGCDRHDVSVAAREG